MSRYYFLTALNLCCISLLGMGLTKKSLTLPKFANKQHNIIKLPSFHSLRQMPVFTTSEDVHYTQLNKILTKKNALRCIIDSKEAEYKPIKTKSDNLLIQAHRNSRKMDIASIVTGMGTGLLSLKDDPRSLHELSMNFADNVKVYAGLWTAFGIYAYFNFAKKNHMYAQAQQIIKEMEQIRDEHDKLVQESEKNDAEIKELYQKLD